MDAAKSRKGKPGFFTGFGVGTVLTTLVALFGIESMRNDACEWATRTVGRYVVGCGDEFKPIEAAEASDFLNEFYGRAGGAAPSAAWDKLSPAAQQRLPRADFVREWEPMLWAELLHDATEPAEEHNTFDVTVRYYGVDGTITERRKQVSLRASGRQVLQVESDDLGTRTDVQQTQYPNVRLQSEAHTYHDPTLDAEVAMFPDETSVGGRLPVLCVLEEGNSPDGQRWLRTPQGWILDEHMAEFDASAIPECYPRRA